MRGLLLCHGPLASHLRARNHDNSRHTSDPLINYSVFMYVCCCTCGAVHRVGISPFHDMHILSTVTLTGKQRRSTVDCTGILSSTTMRSLPDLLCVPCLHAYTSTELWQRRRKVKAATPKPSLKWRRALSAPRKEAMLAGLGTLVQRGPLYDMGLCARRRLHLALSDLRRTKDCAFWM
jgi:hypothetical protein